MRTSFLGVLVALTMTLPAAAELQSWNIDGAHTAAQFSLRHLGISTVRGAFTKVSGTVKYDPSNLNATTVEAIIEAASIDTRVEMRDNDLRGPNFFDATKYPTLTFKSRKVDPAGAGKLKVTGDLTIRGVTKEVIFDVDGPTETVKDPKGNLHMGASASTKINRKEFGVNGAATTAGDEVSITIDMELVKPAS
jgi:polyisoprenoid-binding protein YceI